MGLSSRGRTRPRRADRGSGRSSSRSWTRWQSASRVRRRRTSSSRSRSSRPRCTSALSVMVSIARSRARAASASVRAAVSLSSSSVSSPLGRCSVMSIPNPMREPSERANRIHEMVRSCRRGCGPRSPASGAPPVHELHDLPAALLRDKPRPGCRSPAPPPRLHPSVRSHSRFTCRRSRRARRS